MTTTSIPHGIPRRFQRRRFVPTSASQAIVWGLTVVLVIGPLVPLIYTSFRSQAFYLPGGSWSVQPYRTLFDDPAYWRAVENTLLFAVITTTLAVGLGTIFAVLINRTNMPGGRWLRWLLIAPIVIPPLGLIVGWTSIYGTSGYLTQLVHRSLGLPAWNLSSILGMAVLGSVVTIPITFLTCQVSLQGSDTTLENAAVSSGASPGAVLRRITIPLLRPAILNSSILVFALSLEILGIPLFLGTPANINLYASYLYNGWGNSTTPDPPFVSAGAILLLIVVTILLIARTRLLGSEQRFIVPASRGPAKVPPLDVGRWRLGWLAFTGAFVAFASLVPLVGLVLMSSVKELTILVAPWHLWTSGNWHQIITNHGFRNAIINSIIIATIGSLLTVMFVAIATLIAHRSRFRLRHTLPAILVYPRAIPGIVLGIGFFWSYLLVNVPGSFLRNSIWGEMLALSIRNITIAYVVLYPSLAKITREFDDASTASGATWWTTGRRITLPIVRPAMLTALVLMFITLLSDYDPLVFLQKPGTEVMGVTMLQAWQKGEPGQVAAMAVIQLAIVGLVIIGATRLVRRVSRA
ncbi:MAG TPA: iron ABC transporter permease [Acidimicrobiales bacterium]|jgi:iron(III) transport system permease protein|nr:iron ABC transporter permease [Acidimicrobiales bacterium]